MKNGEGGDSCTTCDAFLPLTLLSVSVCLMMRADLNNEVDGSSSSYLLVAEIDAVGRAAMRIAVSHDHGCAHTLLL